jgi:hypothetical protein
MHRGVASRPACASVARVAEVLLWGLRQWRIKPLARWGGREGAVEEVGEGRRACGEKGEPVTLIASLGSNVPGFAGGTLQSHRERLLRAYVAGGVLGGAGDDERRWIRGHGVGRREVCRARGEHH